MDTSVIIPSFNNSKYIGRAIRSCIKQSLDKNKYEIIVVDDASTDNSRNVIDTFDVKKIYLKKNSGIAIASNTGIRKALGSFIIRVDSDDYINEHTLLIMTEIMLSNKDIGFVYPDHLLVDEDETVLGRETIDTLPKLYRHGAGIMFRKSYLEAIGLYDEDRKKHADDYDLLIRYLKNFNGYHLKLDLYRYRQHEGNTTKKVEERNKDRRDVEKKHKIKDFKL